MRYAIALLWTLTGLIAPLITRRSDRIERGLGLVLSDADAGALAAACNTCGHTIGHYYRWYLLKLLFARRWRLATACGLLRSVASVVRRSSISTALAGSNLANERGVVVAIPHHGHYIAAVIATVEALLSNRAVCVMYGDPQTHPGNEIFDRICEQLWKGGRTRSVLRLRPDGAGLLAATRALRAGAALVTFPDVHQDVRATYAFQFLGHRLDLMLGAAALARSGNAVVVPLAPLVCERTGWLRIDPLEPIDPATFGSNPRLVTNYAVTKSMFKQFELAMGGQILYWQYVRQLYGAPPPLPRIDPNEAGAMLDALIDSHVQALGIAKTGGIQSTCSGTQMRARCTSDVAPPM